MSAKGIWDDRKGVIELSFQFVLAVGVAGVAIALIGVAGYEMWKEYQLKEAIKEVNKIVLESEKMLFSSDASSIKKIRLNFPKGMRKAVFGSSDENMKNRYYVMMEWGENRIFYAENVYFTGEDGGAVILYKKTREIYIELVEKGKYVKIIPA